MITEKELEKLKGRSPGIIAQESSVFCAVCVPFIEGENGPELVFEKRASKLKAQPGDICFPGGKLQESESPEEAAVRELCEELKLKRESVELIAPLDILSNGTLILYPFLVRLKNYSFSFSESEVEEVFSIPLKAFSDQVPRRCDLELKHLPSDSFPWELVNGGENYRFRKRIDNELFYFAEGRVIWGLTARLIRSFTEIIKTEAASE